MHYHEIGTPFVKRPSIFSLNIDDVFPTIDPSSFGFIKITPRNYYVTSGDAIQKALYMKNDIINLKKSLGEISREGQDNQSFVHQSLMTECDDAIRSTNKLLDNLYEARGEFVFLETEWDDHHLLCIPKNPRGM